MSNLSALNETLAAELLRARLCIPMTQRELAEELGVSIRTIQEWEYGRSLPRPKHRRALAKWLEAHENGKAA